MDTSRRAFLGLLGSMTVIGTALKCMKSEDLELTPDIAQAIEDAKATVSKEAGEAGPEKVSSHAVELERELDLSRFPEAVAKQARLAVRLERLVGNPEISTIETWDTIIEEIRNSGISPDALAKWWGITV